MVWTMNSLRKVWKRWFYVTKESANNRTVAELVWIEKVLSKYFTLWKQFRSKKIEKSAHFVISGKQRAVVLTGLCFRNWCRIARQKEIVGARSTSFVDRCVRRRVKRLFRGWFQAAVRHREKRNFRLSLRWKEERRLKEIVYLHLADGRVRRKRINKFKFQQATRIRLHILIAWSKQIKYDQWCRSRAWSKKRQVEIRCLQKSFISWLLHHQMSRTNLAIKRSHTLERRIKELHEELEETQRLKLEMDKLSSALKAENSEALDGLDHVEKNVPCLLEARLQWTLVSQENEGWWPSSRAGHSSVSISCTVDSRVSRYITVFGGYNGKSSFRDIFLYDTAQKRWRIPMVSAEEGSAFPPGVWNHTACGIHNKMIVFGGFDGYRELSEVSVLCFSDNGYGLNQATQWVLHHVRYLSILVVYIKDDTWLSLVAIGHVWGI